MLFVVVVVVVVVVFFFFLGVRGGGGFGPGVITKKPRDSVDPKPYTLSSQPLLGLFCFGRNVTSSAPLLR